MRNFAAVQAPLLHPEIPGDPPSDPAGITPQSRPLVCEFCECTITRERGEVLRRSGRAKRYMEQEHAIESLREELERVQGDLTAARQALAEASAQLGAVREGGGGGRLAALKSGRM